MLNLEKSILNTHAIQSRGSIGNELPVSIYWDNVNSAGLIPGKYAVDVFADGLNIGSTSLEIK
jgi:hypothetical protein